MSDVQSLLGLRKPPIAIAFLNSPPDGVDRWSGPPAPAGCFFWKQAQEGRTFYTVPSDHYNCAVGAHTHKIGLPPERADELGKTVGFMVDNGYVTMEEVPGIPTLPSRPAVVAYGPANTAPFKADVVVVAAQPAQAMVLYEAALQAGIGGRAWRRRWGGRGAPYFRSRSRPARLPSPWVVRATGPLPACRTTKCISVFPATNGPRSANRSRGWSRSTRRWAPTTATNRLSSARSRGVRSYEDSPYGSARQGHRHRLLAGGAVRLPLPGAGLNGLQAAWQVATTSKYANGPPRRVPGRPVCIAQVL